MSHRRYAIVERNMPIAENKRKIAIKRNDFALNLIILSYLDPLRCSHLEFDSTSNAGCSNLGD